MPVRKVITTIPARQGQAAAAKEHHRKRRVAGYARVSTDREDQANSFDAQVDYYTSYIKMRDDWQFVDVYTDAADIIGLNQNPTL